MLAMMEGKKDGKAAGGHARAEVLPAERRSVIAKNAAAARWSGDIRQATHGSEDRPLRIGDIELPCYVLSDETRVLSQRGILSGLGMRSGGRPGGTRLTYLLRSSTFAPFVSPELLEILENPIKFHPPRGGRTAFGHPATILNDICDVVLAARAAGVLQPHQVAIAQRCEILVRAFGKLGIIGLVDEVTGYQEVRHKLALQTILDAYLRKELAAWAKRFPDEFYEHIFRLRNWEWKGRGKNPPQAVAGYTKDIVYARLTPSILEELEKRNPIAGGRRRAAHHQWLTEDVGHPALAQHLHAVITLMRVSKTWDQFKLMLEIAHPKRGDTLQLPVMAEQSKPEVELEPEPAMATQLDLL
jgi:hypothetical protein